MNDFNFTTTDGKRVSVRVFNNVSVSAHVYFWGGGNDAFTINGRDAYEVLKSDGAQMTWDELKQMFK